jgi:hypothetical protein
MFLGMPHIYNRRAFGSVVRYVFGPADDDDPLRLLALYCALVRLELALKDHDASFRRKGHDVCGMLENLGIATALVVQLRTRLQTLQCVRLDGGSGTVRPDRYPDLRYLRHASDFPGESTTQQLEHALDVLRDIEDELTSRGIEL